MFSNQKTFFFLSFNHHFSIFNSIFQRHKSTKNPNIPEFSFISYIFFCISYKSAIKEGREKKGLKNMREGVVVDQGVDGSRAPLDRSNKRCPCRKTIQPFYQRSQRSFHDPFSLLTRCPILSP